MRDDGAFTLAEALFDTLQVLTRLVLIDQLRRQQGSLVGEPGMRLKSSGVGAD